MAVPSELDCPLSSDPRPRVEPHLGRSVSLEHAAQLLNVSRRTIYYRIRAGRLRTIRTLGGSQRVLLDSLFECGFRPQAVAPAAHPAFATIEH
jgi:excisionase family DNA binding protein